MPHITQMRAKYSRKLQRPGYETNYEPQYAEFELVSTFGDEEQADDSDLHDLMDQVRHVVNDSLGLDRSDQGGQSETEVASRDANTPEVEGVKPSGRPISRRGGASSAAAPSEPTNSSASAAVAASSETSPVPPSSRRGGRPANPPVTPDTSAPPVTSGSASRRGGSVASTEAKNGSAGNATKSPSDVKDTDLSKAASQMAAKKGTEAVFKVLSMFGAANVNELKNDQRQEFLDAIKEMLAE